MIHKSTKPSPPKILECRVNSADIAWDPCTLVEGTNQIQYRILLGKNHLFCCFLKFDIFIQMIIQ